MRHLFTVCTLLLNLSIFAQNYDLNTYKFRYQKWRLMSVDLHFSGSHNQYSNFSENTLRNFGQQGDTVFTLKNDNNSHSLSFYAPFTYRSFVNIERLQQSQTLDYNIRLDKKKDGGSNFSTLQNLNYHIDNRFYSGKYFTEINFSSRNHLNSENYSKIPANGPYPLQKQTMSSALLNYNISIGKGRGRMEYVSDAVSAIFLLRDLKVKAGIGYYSNEQIEAVAKGITSIYNRRYMDFRFRLIDQLTLLDSVMKTNNIASDKAIRYYTTINDNWLYANRFQRYSGSRWSVNVFSEGNLRRQKNVTIFRDTNLHVENTSFNRESFDGLSVNYSHSRQLGLFLQRTFGLGTSSGIIFNTFEQTLTDYKSKNDKMRYEINFNWGYLFQPNTRTYLNFSIYGIALVYKNLYGLRTGNPNDNKNRDLDFSIQSQLEFFRFISPRLYYSSRFNFTYQEGGSRYSDIRTNSIAKSASLPFSFSMGLTYLFF